MFFVERLESMVANGRKLPLTTNVVVDQTAALDLIDELRHAIPEEVQSARRISAEGERIIERAQREAEEIIARAQEQAAFLIEERELTRAAQEESARILEQADMDAEEVRRGADEYAASILITLEGEVVRTLQGIKRGIALLDERRAQLRTPEPAPMGAAMGAAMPLDGHDIPDMEPEPGYDVEPAPEPAEPGYVAGWPEPDPEAVQRSRRRR
ncbi:MAG: hypothetical protein MUE82_04220 [Chloroflexi bacterium]|jgi:hypothetical protein|nr:hypothetical protein [Chloroflexota bacterium]